MNNQLKENPMHIAVALYHVIFERSALLKGVGGPLGCKETVEGCVAGS